MILPFVREIFADLEHTPAFERVRRHLSLASGRRRVSGLPATARSLYIPLRGAQGLVGVLGVLPNDPRRFNDAEQRAQLDVFANQIASALERARLAEQAQHAHLQVEAERLRSSLLSSVSHDLRTPLSVIKGAASALAEPDSTLGA